MSFTIRNLFELSSMEKASIISGEHNIDNEITNILVMEAPDVSKWLKPGYLLLTSFYAMKDFNDNQLVALIKDLVKYNCSGLIIKTDRLVKNIPEALIKACKKYKLPLIKISKEVAYSDIQVEVMQQLFNRKVALLDYYYNVHNLLIKFSLKQPTIPEVLQYLYAIIETPCALLNSQKNVMYCTDENLKSVRTIRNIQSKNRILFEYESSEIQMGESEEIHTQITIKIPLIDNNKQYYLVIVCMKEKISDKDYIVIENAVSFLQMLLVQRVAVSNIKQHYLNDLMDDLLGEKFDSKEHLHELMSKLRIKISDEDELFHVVTIYFFLPEKSKTKLKNLLEDFSDNIKFIWSGSVYRLRENRLILLLPSLSLSPENVKKKFNEDVKNILKSISSDNITYKAGISDPSRIDSLQKPTAQSRVIVKKVMSRNSKSFIANSDDIGFYKFFVNISQDVDLINLVPERLLTLKQEHPQLYDTLRVFLDTNQHIKESANLMALHTKTIRYRINKILEITGIDFNNSEELLQYGIGFRVLELI